jgi:thiol-disulfide isomerase/thioredoxin
MMTIRRIWLFAGLMLLIACGCSPGTSTADTTEPATPGLAAPQVVTLELMEWDGVKKIIESHKGKVVVVDCWATYCVPCRKEFPGLVTLSRELPDDVVCISVSLDEAAEKEEALDFLKQQKALMTNILCTTDADTLYDQILKVGSIPAIFVYGRDGAIARTFTGANPDGGEYTYAGHITPFVRELASQN